MCNQNAELVYTNHSVIIILATEMFLYQSEHVMNWTYIMWLVKVGLCL